MRTNRVCPKCGQTDVIMTVSNATAIARITDIERNDDLLGHYYRMDEVDYEGTNASCIEYTCPECDYEYEASTSRELVDEMADREK